MVIKIKQGTDDLHHTNLMYENEDTARTVDNFFGISTKQKKSKAPDTASLQEMEDHKGKKKAAAATATKEEMQNLPKNRYGHSTTKETKSEAEKTLDACIAQIWDSFVIKRKSHPQDFQAYVNMAAPVKFENGTLFLVVPTCFAKENIENNYLHLFTDELSAISAGLIKAVNVQCPSDAVKNENAFYVKLHLALLKDARITNADLRIYAILLSYRNNKTGKCFINFLKIHMDYNVSLSVIHTGIKRLTETGYIKATKYFGQHSIVFTLIEGE